MVNVVDARCGNADCLKSPKFNFPGEKPGIFCDKHKTEGMVNIYQNKKPRTE